MSLLKFIHRFQEEEGAQDPQDDANKYEDSAVQSEYDEIRDVLFIYGIIAAAVSGVTTVLFPIFHNPNWPIMSSMGDYIKSHIGAYWNVFALWLYEMFTADPDVLFMLTEACVLSMESPFEDQWEPIAKTWNMIVSYNKLSGSTGFVWQQLIIVIFEMAFTGFQMILQMIFLPKIQVAYDKLAPIIEGSIPEEYEENEEAAEEASEE